MTQTIDQISSIFTDGTAYSDEEAWHGVATRLRRESPIYRVVQEGWPETWAILKHADVMAIERRHDIFLNTPWVEFRSIAHDDMVRESGRIPETIIHMDDPAHKKFRGLTADWFTAASLRKNLQPRLDALAKGYVDRMAEMGGSCDFSRDVANYFPLRVIMSMLGVPPEDEPTVLRLTQQIFGNADEEYHEGDTRTQEQRYLEGQAELFGYLGGLTVSRRGHATDDIASVIANGEVDGELLTDMQALFYYGILSTAGHDTVSYTMAAGMKALIDHPEAFAELKANPDPQLMLNAVNEMLRWATPAKGFTRTATEDFEIRDTVIRAGEKVLLSWPSANRDEDVFTDPFTFDIHRANANRHIAFGFGKHFCIGAELARMQLKTFFTEIVSRVDDLEIAGPVQRTSSTLVSGIKHLPIRYSVRD